MPEEKHSSCQNSICQQLNFIKQCREYGLGLWQCPSFLFVVMGGIIVIVIIVTYLIASFYSVDPRIPALIVLGVTVVLFIIGHLIVHSFETLAEVNRLKSEFVSIVSHQLRAPLACMKWCLGLLLSGRLGSIDKKQLEQLDLLKENTERMIRLVNDLLNVSRLEQGRLLSEIKPCSLVEPIEEMVKQYIPIAKARNVKVSFDKDEKEIPLVLTDPRQIRLVIQNLLDNAIRYTRKQGKVKIRLKVKKSVVRCEVEDNGVGIPERDKKHIFKKFFRSQNAMKYQTIGTGLGLYIAKAIVEASGGRMGFESQENKGSTFWFELPIAG